MPIRLGAAVFCGLVLALTGCSAAPGSPVARPSPAVAAPATLPPATPPSAPPPSTNPPMGPVVPTGSVGPPTDAPGAPSIEPYELSHALALEEAAGRQTWHRLECGMQTQCLEAPERACDRWYGQLSRHAQKGQTRTA